MAHRPSGAGAVMAAHAPAQVEGDDAQTALFRKLEFFPTPLWAARAGGELIARLDPNRLSIWEPACGEGHMAIGLAPYCRQLVCSDIHAHDISAISGHWLGSFDFTSDEPHRFDGFASWVVSNPPFGVAAEFVEQGLRRARRGVAILARASFREAACRQGLFARPEYVLRANYIERVPMVLGRYDPDASTATAYSWFVWVHQAAGLQVSDDAAALKRTYGPGAAIEVDIAAGTRGRLFRQTDLRHAKLAPAPLFDGGAA